MARNLLILAATSAALLSSPALAQSINTPVGGAADRNDDLADSIRDDFKRDTPRFGNAGRKLGFDGSLSLQGSASNGNSDTVDLGIGANLGYYDGTNGYQLQLNYSYSEDDGTASEDSLLYDFQYTRDFNPDFYGFAKLTGSIDNASLSGIDTSDNFLGFGVGYRVINTADVQWAVQAGPGYRVADLGGVDDLDEAAFSVSSNYFNRIASNMALTMDTDIITSSGDTVVYNDLGLNVSMTDTLALRTSVVTEYHTDPAPGREDTDNTFGVSLVYSFN